MHIIKGIKRVALGISGGVDSAVAALLLKKEFEVVAVYMKNWDLRDEKGHCGSEKDIEDAESVCKLLNIKFQTVNFVKEYWNEVFTDLISDYENGLTPNPDILCNKNIKFKHFCTYSSSLDCDTIATGHYAQNSFGDRLQYRNDSGAFLLKSADKQKDQTFFLSQISQESLRRTIFPLGNLLKSQVKKIAAEHGLEKMAKKKESMGICFIGSRDFSDFIAEYVKPEEGNFIDIDTGRIVGRHQGKHYWTLGQRCLISGVKHPYYIASKTDSQDIYVAAGHDHPILFSSMLTTENPYWINSEPKELENNKIFECEFRFQHRNPLINCSIMKLDDNRLHIILEEPLRALTPGQFAVLYKGLVCLGSARIQNVGPTKYALNDIDNKNNLLNITRGAIV